MNKIIFIKKNLEIFLIFFFLVCLLIFDLIFQKFNYNYTFLIRSDETLNNISHNLYQENIIKNKFLFKFFVRITKSDKKLKAGEYKFYKNNIFQIIQKLRKGDVYFRKITIPEGLTSREIADIIKNTEGIIIKNKEMQIPNEGYLFPSTYFYTYGTNFNTIIENMKQNMILTLQEAWKNKDNDLHLNNYKEVLILASIIEKETSLEEEKPKIAQVFLNRLSLNMKLQSDPTVIYAIEYELGVKKKELTRKDLNFDSDYNTYLKHGLPKGPISNPGRASIFAVINPEKSNLLYFVSNGEGGHNFSVDYQSHIENIDKWKKKLIKNN